MEKAEKLAEEAAKLLDMLRHQESAKNVEGMSKNILNDLGESAEKLQISMM